MTESSLSSRPKKHRLGRALRNILLVLLVLVLLVRPTGLFGQRSEEKI